MEEFGMKKENILNYACTVFIAIMLLVLFIGLDDKYGWIKKQNSEDQIQDYDYNQEYAQDDYEDDYEDDYAYEEKEMLLSGDKSTYTYDITYEMLARNPNDYINNPVKFTGTITQIVHVNDYGYSGFRMYVDNDIEQNLLVIYETDIIDYNLLENDSVTIYAGFMGLYSYESTLGSTITVPEVCAVMIDLNENALVSNSSLELPGFPLNVSCLNWDKTIETTVNIEDIEYSFEKNYDGTYYLTLRFKGAKTYEQEGLTYAYNFCSYKLYDEDGYIVKSDTISFGDLNVGDKFNNVTETIYDLPAGNYKLELFDYK